MHNNTKVPALKLSIRAASMAFYSKIHGEVQILVDSYRWYSKCLNTQRKALTTLGGTAMPTDEEVLVPVILALYEIYAGTAPTNVFQHLNAATRILDMRGPRNCSSGVSYPLFKALRISDSHRAVVFNKPSVFSKPAWMRLPFLIQPRNAHMYLADIILETPDCIALSGMDGNLNYFFSNPIPNKTNLEPLKTRTNELLTRLDQWATNYSHFLRGYTAYQFTTLDMGTPVEEPPTPESPNLILPDTFVALTAATFKAIGIILKLLLHKILQTEIDRTPGADGEAQTLTQMSDLMEESGKHAQNILEIGEFFESTHPVGFDFLRSVFPVVIVALLGTSEKQRTIARTTLDRWGAKRGLGGLCGAWIDT